MKLLSIAILSATLLLLHGCGRKLNSKPHVSAGTITRLSDFPSKYVSPRNIDIWLPEGYDKNEKYPVIYMNDGQMLFDSTITWNGEEWQVDETLTRLYSNGKIRKCIVVGIFSDPESRENEYRPYVAIDGLAEPARSSLIKSIFRGKPLSDNYIKFIVSELKPAIDSMFSTDKSRKGTFIAGSGLGGLISLYALCRYPDVFGGAASLSTHWPVIGPGFYTERVIKGASSSFRDFFCEHLPFLHARKIYFDFGTAGQDSLYKPYQSVIDSVMRREEFTPGEWMTREFPGLSGDERSCAARLAIPFEFLLGK